jgi:hypothetical protein
MKTLKPRPWRSLSSLALFCLLAVALVGLTQTGDVAAASLTSRIEIQVTAKLSSQLDLVAAEAPLAKQVLLDLTNGTGTNQANTIWSDQRTIAPSTTEDLDIVGGGLTDAFGVAFAPVKVKALIVCASSGNTNNVVLGGDANAVPILSAAATTVSIQPKGCFVLTAPATPGIAVTAGTGDIIQVANSGAGTSVTYDIIVIGTTS